MSKFTALFLAPLSAFLLTNSVNAQSFTTGSTALTSASQVDIDGTAVAGFDLNSTVTAANGPNGVAFTTGTRNNSSTVVNGITFTYNNANNNQAGSTATGSLGSVLDTVGYNYPGSGAATLTIQLAGLTLGQRYELQLFAGTGSNNIGETVTDGSASTLLVGGKGGGTNPGPNATTEVAYVIDTFTGTAGGTETLSLVNNGAASDGTDQGVVFFNAINLRAVPEPSTVASMFVAALAFTSLVIFRRRLARVA